MFKQSGQRSFKVITFFLKIVTYHVFSPFFHHVIKNRYLFLSVLYLSRALLQISFDNELPLPFLHILISQSGLSGGVRLKNFFELGRLFILKFLELVLLLLSDCFRVPHVDLLLIKSRRLLLPLFKKIKFFLFIFDFLFNIFMVIPQTILIFSK